MLIAAYNGNRVRRLPPHRSADRWVSTLVRRLALVIFMPLLLLCIASTASALNPVQQRYLSLAQRGVASAHRHWWDPRRGWYDARLQDHERYPLATIWDIVPLFQSLDAIAIAEPTAANKRAVTRFATGAERYLNRGLHPLPG